METDPLDDAESSQPGLTFMASIRKGLPAHRVRRLHMILLELVRLRIMFDHFHTRKL